VFEVAASAAIGLAPAKPQLESQPRHANLTLILTSIASRPSNISTPALPPMRMPRCHPCRPGPDTKAIFPKGPSSVKLTGGGLL
jgi:hypothetical protein